MEQLLTVRRKMDLGEMRPCWTRQFLESKKTGISGDYEASCVLGMMALVGIFTVCGPLSYFLVAMVHHREWQAAVQKEVDENCKGRLPVLEDTPNLPILRACIKETMRWRPNVPTGTNKPYVGTNGGDSFLTSILFFKGVAHETEEDDAFHGYLIPKGTRILPLDWFVATYHYSYHVLLP